MTTDQTTRRQIIGGAASIAALGAGLMPRDARAAAAPVLPTSPVTINVVDVAGQLQLTQAAIQAYATANPKLVSKIAFSQAPAPELPGKIKAQQDAGRVDIDLVLTGTDGLSAGIDQKLWVPLVSDYAEALPDLKSIYLPGALKMQGLAQDQAVCVVFCPAGPILEWMPDAVKTPPKTAQELLDWTKAHPKRFIYARPANSGPGRTFLQGLPYILGDKDPKDPDKGWDKTWAYLVEPTRARRGPEGGTGRHAGRLPLGHRRAVLGYPEGRIER
jgi:putative spermidine/putrescine transport system substrate-binding protein